MPTILWEDRDQLGHPLFLKLDTKATTKENKMVYGGVAKRD